jgi:hypothetical protein
MTREELIEYYVKQTKEYDKLIKMTDAEIIQHEEAINQDAQPDA